MRQTDTTQTITFPGASTIPGAGAGDTSTLGFKGGGGRRRKDDVGSPETGGRPRLEAHP